MKDHPILFAAPMVRALLAGTKTQTRRVYTVRKHPDMMCSMAASELVREEQHVIDRACPYGQAGDRMWVRETWAPHPDFPESTRRAVYRADPECEHDVPRWKPNIHMFRWASRILLQITSVRVERLQQIGEADARAEGVTIEDRHMNGYCAGEFYPPSIRAFRDLWQSINGASSWDANPWVWAIEFKRIAP